MCPMPSESWSKLKKVYKGDLTESYRVYMAHNGELPTIMGITELKTAIGWSGGNLSMRQEAMLVKKVNDFNRNPKNNQSHRVTFAPSSGSSSKATLHVNYMPNTRNIKKELVLKTLDELEGNVVLETYESVDDKITDLGNNQWEAHGEIYPSKEDARNSFYTPEYQLNAIGLPSEDAGLDQAMMDMLRPFGITKVEIDNFKERFGIDGVAAADLLNKIIYVAQGKADVSTLPEEAAHFIIEMMGENHPLFKGMANVVTQTAEYLEVKRDYGAVYNNDESRIKKEAMGKVLAKYFIKQYAQKEALPERVQSVFERAYNWFKNLFKKVDNSSVQTELDRVYGVVAGKAMSGNLKLDPNLLSGAKAIYYELDSVAKVLKANIAKLEARAKEMKRTRAVDMGDSDIADIDLAIDMLKTKLATNDIKNAIIRFLDYTYDNELIHFLREIKEYKENPFIFGSHRIVQMKAVLSLHGDMIKQMEKLVATNPDLKQMYDGYVNENGVRIMSAKEQFDKITIALKEVERFANMMADERLRIIYEEIRDPKSEHSVDDILTSTIGDVGSMARYFMPMFTSSDEVNKMVAKVISDIYNETHRRTVNAGQRLVRLQQAMEAVGHKDMAVFHELDSAGKKTGYLISNKKWGEYNQAFSKVFTDIGEVFGMEYSLIDFDSLRGNKDADTVAKFAKKKAIWKEFHKKYSVYNTETLEYDPNPPKNENFDKIINRDKATREYYDAMMGIHDGAKQLLPKQQRSDRYYYMMPQITMEVAQIAKYSNSLMKDIGHKIKEKLTITSQDTEFGDQNGDVRVSGYSAIKTVPMHYTKPLDDMTQLTNDFTGSYTLFLEMALNFRSLTDKLDDIKIIMDAMAERTIYQTAADKEAEEAGRATGLGKKGIESIAYKQLEDFLNANVYGIQQKAVKIKAFGKEIDITKIGYTFINYVRQRNLIWNPFTIGSGLIKSTIDSTIEDVIGEFSTAESKLWAEGEFAKSLPAMMVDFNSRNKTSKFNLMLDYNGLFAGVREQFANMDIKNKFARISQEQVVYGGYAMAGLRVNGILALSMYDNIRLVDGKFMTRAEFKRAGKSDESWASYRDKSLYNAYEAVNGSFKVKAEFKPYVTKEVENKIQRILKHRSAVVEGKLNRLDKGYIFQTLLGQAVMMHRPWLISGIAERFKAKGVNYETGNIEEGYYRTIGRLVMSIFSRNKILSKQGLATWKDLDSFEQRNVYRMGADVGFTVLMTMVFLLANSIADDDDEDNWFIQAMAFLSTRALMEQKAFMSATEAFNMLKSPSAATSMFDVSGALFNSVFNNKEVKYGPYEGMTQREKALIQMSYLKNFFEMQHPELKNKYVKSQIL